MIRQLDALTPDELHGVQLLATRCKMQDGNSPSLYYDLLALPRPLPSNFLYYDENDDTAPIGFLGIYFFFTEGCEIGLVIDPAYRKQGIATKLIKAAIPLLMTQGIQKILFSAPADINDTWLQAKGLTLDHEEYRMQRDPQAQAIASNQKLIVHEATPGDIPQLSELDKRCFPDQEPTALERFQELLDDKEYTLLIASYENHVIGKAHIRWEEDSALFLDIAVFPEHQKQGFGGELLGVCIKRALAAGKTRLMLDVVVSNHHALRLYTRHGFKPIEARSFWEISLPTLKDHLQIWQRSLH